MNNFWFLCDFFLMEKTSIPEITNRHSCSDGDVITDINEYLDCSKAKFEYRFENEQHTREAQFEDFTLHKTIGMGAFGRVMLVNHKSDKETFLAMKVS